MHFSLVLFQVIILEWLLKQRDAVTLVLTSTPSVKNLSAQQWATADELATVLKPFLDVMQETSTAAYLTMSWLTDCDICIVHPPVGSMYCARFC